MICLSELFFTETNEWVCFCAEKAVVGITCKGITGDVVYAELPEIGQKFDRGQPCAIVESAKTTVEVYSPLGGKVSYINDMIYDEPEIISKDPYNTWLFILEDTEEAEDLITKSEYELL